MEMMISKPDEETLIAQFRSEDGEKTGSQIQIPARYQLELDVLIEKKY